MQGKKPEEGSIVISPAATPAETRSLGLEHRMPQTLPSSLRWASLGSDMAPAGEPLKLTDPRRIVLAGWRDEDLTPAPAVVPAPVVPVTPSPTPVVVPRALAPLVKATSSEVRTSMSGRWFAGFDTNLCHVAGYQAVLLEDGISSDAWAKDPFQGSGVYIDNQGPTTIRNWLSVRNGWQPGRPIQSKSQFRHGCYIGGTDEKGNPTGPVVIEDSIFANNAHAGVQCRNAAGTTLRRCVLVSNSVNVLAVAGNVVLEDCLLLGGAWTYQLIQPDPHKPARPVWTDNCGLSAWTNVTLARCTIVGQSGQATPLDPSIKTNSPLGVAANWHHSKNPTGVGVVTGTSSVITRWPGTAIYLGGGTVDQSGIVTKPGNPLIYDHMPILQSVLHRKTTAADASAQIRAAVAKLIA